MVSPQLYLTGAIVLLIFPIKWILAWMIAVVVHELFHYFALRLCHIHITSITVEMGGAKMHTALMEKGTELFCALAGPVGSLSLLLLSRWFPYIAVCGFLQAAYNLLPLFPLDGGRAVICLLQMFGDLRCKGHIYLGIKFVVFTGLLILALVALQYNLGPVPLLFTIILFLKTGMENPLANRQK